MLKRSRSKDPNRKVTPPGPVYMSNEQFGEHNQDPKYKVYTNAYQLDIFQTSETTVLHDQVAPDLSQTVLIANPLGNFHSRLRMTLHPHQLPKVLLAQQALFPIGGHSHLFQTTLQSLQGQAGSSFSNRIQASQQKTTHRIHHYSSLPKSSQPLHTSNGDKDGWRKKKRCP